MNKRLETLIERVSALPEEAQEELLDHVALIGQAVRYLSVKRR